MIFSEKSALFADAELRSGSCWPDRAIATMALSGEAADDLASYRIDPTTARAISAGQCQDGGHHVELDRKIQPASQRPQRSSRSPRSRPAKAEDAGAAAAYKDIEQTLGSVPSFFKAFPEVGIAGAWAEFKSVQLNPDTALDGKTKELIGLAVAGADPVPVLRLFPHGRRQGQWRDRRGNPRGRRHGGDRAALEHGAQRHAGRPADGFKREIDTVLTHRRRKRPRRRSSEVNLQPPRRRVGRAARKRDRRGMHARQEKHHEHEDET